MDAKDLAGLSREVELYLETLKRTLDSIDREAMNAFFALLLRAREEERQIFIMGNGGSAATASHFVCDFNKGLSAPGAKPFKFLCLNDNVPSMMAWANDLGYGDVFVQQLKNFMRAGDVVIGLSGSGNSTNVVRAIEWANAHGASTFALVGYDGGRLKQVAGGCIHVAVADMQIVEDVHMILDHMTMRVLGKVASARDVSEQS